MPTEAIINVNGANVQTLEVLFLTTLLTVLPSLVVMMTSFTRYVIVFSFLRTAMGTQQTPPNMVLVGMALILTLHFSTETDFRHIFLMNRLRHMIFAEKPAITWQ